MSVLLTKYISRDTKLTMREIISSFVKLQAKHLDGNHINSGIIFLFCASFFTNDLFRDSWMINFHKNSRVITFPGTLFQISSLLEGYTSPAKNHFFLLKLLFCCCEISFLHYLANSRKLEYFHWRTKQPSVISVIHSE